VIGETRDLDGRPVWVSDVGEGDPVVLLHGGLGSSDDLAPQGEALAANHRVVAFDRRGHGRTADGPDPFSYAAMADETVAVLESVVGGPAHLVGWSDGGIVALYVALARPDLVRSLVPIGANFHHDGLLPEFFELGADDAVTEMLAASYAARSPDGTEHWPEVFAKAVDLWRREPNLTVADLARITAPVLVLVGDDEPIPLSHTCALYEALPNGQLAVVPGTSHVVPLEKAELVNRLIADFLAADGPPATFMPMRRARPVDA
jgi:pimeloyl-ACP methyl ester carboxylesterase